MAWALRWCGAVDRPPARGISRPPTRGSRRESPPARRFGPRHSDAVRLGIIGRDSDTQRERLRKSFKSFSSQLSALPAMAEALREAIFRSASGTPLDFYRQLGVKSGFVRPAGNNAVRKFYTLEGVLLEAVLASILPDGQMTFRDFLEQLYSRYGLLTGGRPEDARVLLQHGIGNATVQDLRANSHVFRQQLVSLGWARQFADGVLVVKVPEALQ